MITFQDLKLHELYDQLEHLTLCGSISYEAACYNSYTVATTVNKTQTSHWDAHFHYLKQLWHTCVLKSKFKITTNHFKCVNSPDWTQAARRNSVLTQTLIQECWMKDVNKPNWLSTHFRTWSAWQPGYIWRLSSDSTVCVRLYGLNVVFSLPRRFTTVRAPFRCLCGAGVSGRGRNRRSDQWRWGKVLAR